MLEPEEIRGGRHDLARMLRDLRLESGLTGDRLAVRCGMSQSKISKIENARAVPSLADLERLLDALGVAGEVREAAFALAQKANTEYESLRAELRRGLHHKQRELASFEDRSTHLRFFLPSMLTGLLHTPEYARASMAMLPGAHAQAVARPLARQEVLYRPDKRFTFLFTEQALRWPLCPPPVMAVQLGRVAALADLPNISMGVVPAGTGVVPDGPVNTFTVYDDRLATAETFSGTLLMRDPRDVEYHLEVFVMFERYAIFGDEFSQVLAKIRKEFIT